MTTDPCDFCGKQAHAGPCAELLTYVGDVRAGIQARAALALHLYRCNDCGDPINHDGVCPACEEVAAVDRLLVTGMVRDAFGISLELRAGCRKDALAIDRVCGF